MGKILWDMMGYLVAHPTNRKWVSSPQSLMWINPTYPIYNWGYNPLTKWDEPPSILIFWRFDNFNDGAPQ